MQTVRELKRELTRIESQKAAAKDMAERARLAKLEISTRNKLNLARKLAPAEEEPQTMSSREALQHFREELAEIRNKLHTTTNPEVRAALLNQEQSALEKIQLFRSFVPEEMGCLQLIEYRRAQA